MIPPSTPIIFADPGKVGFLSPSTSIIGADPEKVGIRVPERGPENCARGPAESHPLRVAVGLCPVMVHGWSAWTTHAGVPERSVGSPTMHERSAIRRRMLEGAAPGVRLPGPSGPFGGRSGSAQLHRGLRSGGLGGPGPVPLRLSVARTRQTPAHPTLRQGAGGLPLERRSIPRRCRRLPASRRAVRSACADASLRVPGFGVHAHVVHAGRTRGSPRVIGWSEPSVGIARRGCPTGYPSAPADSPRAH